MSRSATEVVVVREPPTTPVAEPVSQWVLAALSVYGVMFGFTRKTFVGS